MSLARLDAITHDFGDHRVLDGVDLHVDPGEVVGLIGANGAGKTTTIRVLLGLLTPTAGRVELVGGAPSRDTRARLGHIPQGLGLWQDLTIDDHIELMTALYGPLRPLDDPVLREAREVPVGALPVGVQRRVAFHLAVAHDPSLLVLDEPTSGVDPLARARLWDGIHMAVDAGIGALVSTHYLDEAEQCDRVLLLVDGRVVADGPAEDIAADATAVEVEADDWQRAWELLDDADLAALPAGRRLRVTGATAGEVRDRLERAGVPAEVREIAATLEEVFLLATTGTR